jgi:plastocyanin
MSVETTFYVLGGALVVLALVVSYIGVRGKGSFPSSRGAMVGGLAVVAVVVIGTASFAVALAREEKEHRDHEQAEEEAHAEEDERGSAADAGAAPAAQEKEGTSEGGQPPGAAPTGGASEELAVSSPEDGSFVYEPPALQSAPATVTLAYDNPSPLVHNINLEVEGETIAESEDVAEGSTEVTAELAPGEYLYYCSIPGHREGGMEGVLTVE